MEKETRYKEGPFTVRVIRGCVNSPFWVIQSEKEIINAAEFSVLTALVQKVRKIEEIY